MSSENEPVDPADRPEQPEPRINRSLVEGTRYGPRVKPLGPGDYINRRMIEPEPLGVIALAIEDEAPPDLPIPTNAHQLIDATVGNGVEGELALSQRLGVGKVAHDQNYVGLSRVQRKFILNRALVEGDKAAADYVGVSTNTVSMWKRKNPVFMRAYASLFVDPTSVGRTMLQNLVPTATDVLEDALTHPGVDMKTKLDAVKLVLASQGVLDPKTGESTANDYERALAQHMMDRGIALPPQLQQIVVHGNVEITNRSSNGQ